MDNNQEPQEAQPVEETVPQEIQVITYPPGETVKGQLEAQQQLQSDNIANPEVIVQADAQQEKTEDAAQNQGTEKPVPSTQEAIQGEVVEKHAGGRPTKYNEQMLQIANEYYQECLGNREKKKRMPLIEELARYCDVDHETLQEWAEKTDENGESRNPEFSALYKKIKSFQKEALIQRGFSMKNPTFAIFLLKAQHGMIESEKRILAGERQGEPIQINTVNYQDTKQIPDQVVQQADELSE